jgi:hypothetical protein
MARHFGIQRSDRKRFPYEPRVIGGRLFMPAELQSIHELVLGAAMVENVTDETRAVVETLWPELGHKLGGGTS